MPPHLVQELAGHADIRTTRRRGNSAPFERLLDFGEVAPLPIAELLEDVTTGQAKPIVGPPGESEIAGYEVIGEIGRGGLGVVYEALQTSTKRTVALKVMPAGRFASRTGRQRFQHEVELTGRLQHRLHRPNALPGAGDRDGQVTDEPIGSICGIVGNQS